jgi:hypothetical protein
VVSSFVKNIDPSSPDIQLAEQPNPSMMILLVLVNIQHLDEAELQEILELEMSRRDYKRFEELRKTGVCSVYYDLVIDTLFCETVLTT